MTSFQTESGEAIRTRHPKLESALMVRVEPVADRLEIVPDASTDQLLVLIEE